MDELRYNNKTYKRISGKWVDDSYIAVPVTMQSCLNNEFMKLLNLSESSVDYLTSEGDKLKDAGSYSIAVRYYEEVIPKCDINKLTYVLPKLSSCYRNCNMPQKAIDLFLEAKAKYGQRVVNHVMLTSVASAYCDINELEQAENCCREARKTCPEKDNAELKRVELRIQRLNA